MERFQPMHRRRRRAAARAARSASPAADVEADCDGATPILVAGEEAGADAALRLPDGHLPHLRRRAAAPAQVRDLRTGEVHGSEGEMVRTCVNAPEGPIEIAL